MKLLNSTLVLISLAAVAAAQSAAPPSQTVATKPAAAAQGTASKSPFAAKKTAAKPAAPVMGTAVSSKKGGAARSSMGKSAAPEMAAAKSPASKGRRDPFINPVVKAATTGAGLATPCSNGKRCLAIREMTLRGIVKGQTGMIAVVENTARKTYFLRENDPVFNGYVVKITGDSVIFKENTQDSSGNASSHEVVKTMAPQA